MGQEQRNAIRKALNEDAEKLLQEGDPADPQLRRLRREMEEVNRLFDDFEKRARAEGEHSPWNFFIFIFILTECHGCVLLYQILDGKCVHWGVQL
jgi:hypothetical protein